MASVVDSGAAAASVDAREPSGAVVSDASSGASATGPEEKAYVVRGPQVVPFADLQPVPPPFGSVFDVQAWASSPITSYVKHWVSPVLPAASLSLRALEVMVPVAS